MVSLPPFRAIILLFAGVLAPLFLTQCKTAAKSYKDVSYDPAKLKTPAGHGLERNDYPFDESGAYRKDWVKSNATGRDRSASPQAGASTAVAAADTTPPTSASTSYPTYAEAAAARASGNSPGNSAGGYVGPAGDTSGMATTLASAGSLPAAGSGVELASAGVPSAPSSPAQTSYHKVSSGDTLFALASKYNTSVPELKRVNGLSGDSIRAGQSLRIP